MLESSWPSNVTRFSLRRATFIKRSVFAVLKDGNDTVILMIVVVEQRNSYHIRNTRNFILVTYAQALCCIYKSFRKVVNVAFPAEKTCIQLACD